MEASEAIVVGGGLIGCAIACELRGLGMQVTLLERGRVGGEASDAAAGILGAQAEAPNPTVARLGVESRALYAATLAELRAETGMSVERGGAGTLCAAFDESDEREIEARLEWQGREEMPFTRLTASEARRLERNLNPAVRSAVLFPEEGYVDNVALTCAYAEAARRRGAKVREGVPVRRVVVRAGRVEGVETDHGPMAAEMVINAAGAWADRVLPEHPLGIRPVRGQMVCVRGADATPKHILHSRDGYAVPRGDGRTLLGSTLEEAGFEKSVTAAGVMSILAASRRLAPAFGSLAVERTWAGLRPASPDGLPVIGSFPGIQGYLVATGHYRSGVLLAPLTARLIGRCTQGEPMPWADLLAPTRLLRVQP
jgi:glycine oxidase